MDKARILIFDLEATALNASFGHALCVGYMYLNDKQATVITTDDFPALPGEEPDAGLMRRMHTLLRDEADILVTYYGKEYDRKFLNTRMLLAGLPPLPPLSAEHVDLYFTVRGNLRLHSNRLQALSETLGCPKSKTAVRADVWRAAMRGDSKALAYVVQHCKLDVEILKWCYMKLRGFVRQHPPVTVEKEACVTCGVKDWESRGRRFVRGEEQQRNRCRRCGRYSYIKLNGKRVA